MKPYLAILQDSFRFALSSRVLLVMIVIISVTLIAVAPAGYKEQLTTDIYQDEITDRESLALRLASGAELGENTSLRRIWDQLDSRFQKRLTAYANSRQVGEESEETKDDDEKTKPPSLNEFPKNLNEILGRREFYDEDIWKSRQLTPEANNLIEMGVGELSNEQVMRLNRILLETSLPNLIKAGPPTSIRIVYGPFDFDWVVRIRVEELRDRINTFLPWVIDTFLLSVGLLVAAIVTAPLIPQTFEPGSLTLQLSKPISRSLLFLSKFFGGCAFTLLCAVYLFIGLWLILGIRWGLWTPKILWCIPIYVFVFAIYYTVSAIAGLIWRNAVVSIIIVVAFWFFCYLIGTGKGIWQGMLDIQRFKQIVVVDENVIAIDEMNVPKRWNASNRSWDDTLLTRSQERRASFLGVSQPIQPRIGPVADRDQQRLYLIQNPWRNPWTWNSDAKVSVAAASDGFSIREIADAPAGTFALAAEKGGTILAIANDGKFYRISKPQPGEGDDESEEQLVSTVEECGPEEKIQIPRPYAAAMNPETDTLAVYSRGTLRLFRADENGKYSQTAETKLDGQFISATSLAYRGGSLLVAHSNGKLFLFDGETLKEKKQFEPETKTGPRHVRAAPGGKWMAVSFHNGKLWLIDPKAEEIHKPSVKGQGKITAIEFSGPDRLMICGGDKRIYEVSADDASIEREFAPKMSAGERIYRFIVVPLYTVSPKPREFYKTTQYLISGKESVGDDRQMDAMQQKIDPWQPVWSSLIFMVVMLGLACLYIERQEF